MQLESNQPHTSDKATDCWLKYINAPHKRWPVVPGRSRTVRQMQQFRRPSCPRWSSPPRGSPTTSSSFFRWFWWKEWFRPDQCKCHRAPPPQIGLDWLGVVRRRSARRRREGSSSWSWSCAPAPWCKCTAGQDIRQLGDNLIWTCGTQTRMPLNNTDNTNNQFQQEPGRSEEAQKLSSSLFSCCTASVVL